MIQHSELQMSLYRARLLLEEGRHEAALLVLEAIRTEDAQQQREVTYLLGWCYIQRKQWRDAIRVLSPLLEHVQIEGEQETLVERERLALYLLRLGEASVNLAQYEDASLHFTICLRVLQDRRVHLPSVRIKARYFLAMTCITRGMYTAAIQHYEEALRLCRHYNEEEDVADIYHGLCDAYRHIGDFIKADIAGQEALCRYQERMDRQKEARMHHLLGRIRFLLSDYREAADHYTESLALATNHNGPTLALVNCAALADLRLAEGRLEEAKRYCQLVLEMMERTPDSHMRGVAYHVVGKVTHEEARHFSGEEQHALLGETVSWLEKANAELALTQAYADMAEVYGSLAQALEDLGRFEEAIKSWRAGYEVLSHAKEPK